MSMAKLETARPGGFGRWTKGLLIASLALNLLIVGVIAGGVLNRHWRGSHAMGHDVGFGPFTEALSQDDRAAIRKAFLTTAPGHRAMRQEIRQDMADLVAILRADPLDAAAAGSILEMQNQRIVDRLGLGRRLLLDRISAMSPEARTEFADRVEQALDRPWRDRRRPQ
jgi:uncharacterized membrane protein